jgi:preprotein translocase subunit SecA
MSVFIPTQELKKSEFSSNGLPMMGLAGSLVDIFGVFKRIASKRELFSQRKYLISSLEEYKNASKERVVKDLEKMRHQQLCSKMTQAELVKLLGLLGSLIHKHLGLSPHPVQMLGALGLCRKNLLEMATGEGKTITLAMAGAALGLKKKPVHILTANDYLAKRDAMDMLEFYQSCSLTVSHVIGEMDTAQRAQAYQSDVVYTTAKELVADYLRDQLALKTLKNGERRLIRYLLRGTPKSIEETGTVLRGLHTVLVDEADHLLIDEAQTPLIISSPISDPMLEQAAAILMKIIKKELRADRDYQTQYTRNHIELKPKTLPKVISKLEHVKEAKDNILLSSDEFVEELVLQGLKACELFDCGKQYLIMEENEVDTVKIIDQGTGRILPGRTWNMGLHQMIEAKESVPFSKVTKSMAGMSFQRFFRGIPHLAGVSGTLWENRFEFERVYNLISIALGTHKPSCRTVHPLKVFGSKEDKYLAALELIKSMHEDNKPVLVGTKTLNESVSLSKLLKKHDIQHNLLNAENDEIEAEIVSNAGLRGQITIATNMAGRGTDIKLSKAVIDAGGLNVVVLERNLSYRIDRQLYGRCARQGQPGEVYVFSSIDEEVLVNYLPFNSSKIVSNILTSVFKKWGMEYVIRFCQSRYDRLSNKSRRALLKSDKNLTDSLN